MTTLLCDLWYRKTNRYNALILIQIGMVWHSRWISPHFWIGELGVLLLMVFIYLNAQSCQVFLRAQCLVQLCSLSPEKTYIPESKKKHTHISTKLFANDCILYKAISEHLMMQSNYKKVCVLYKIGNKSGWWSWML